MTDDSSRGPEVAAHEELLRAIVNPRWWNADEKHLSSGVFGFNKFSAYVESMTDKDTVVKQFPEGSGMLEFNCGVARNLGFDARHEPEDGNQAHANVYCDHSSSKRKKQARKLVEVAVVIQEPDIAKLQSSK